ncbi:MAG TPA: hypothetical protein VM510_11680 [Caulifigura sp.]|nr:hypothetical protein [Caulifigura sp.]
MSTRLMSIAMAMVLSVGLGSEASAAKPVFSTITMVTVPNITVGGEVDTESELVPVLALVEIYYNRGLAEIHIEAYGDVLNASGKKVKITDPTGFEPLAIPDDGIVIVKKFSYTVSKKGEAKLKAVILTDAFMGGVEP